MSRFLVGDTVMLTGLAWDDFEPETYTGAIVKIHAIHDGDAYFEREGYEWFVDHDPRSEWSGAATNRT